MKNKPDTDKRSTFGVGGDYMTAGIEQLDSYGTLGSPQGLPGRVKPPAPWDDREGTGMSLGEGLKEKMEDIIES